MITTILTVASLLITPSISTKSNGCYSNSNEFDTTPGKSTVYESNTGRNYTIIVPSGYKQNKKVPLVVVLPGFITSTRVFYEDFPMEDHVNANNYIGVILEGGGERANGEPLYGWNDLTSSASPGPNNIPTCDPEGIYNEIVWPGKYQCGDTCNWNYCTRDDIGYIDRIANRIQNNFCIDIQREYITGFSNGGMMTQTMACQRNSRFAAAAAFNGQRHEGYNCGPQNGPPMPFMNIWNTYDNIIPGQSIVARNSWYYTKVIDVQAAFAEYNDCDMDATSNYVTYETQRNAGWKNFHCSGYLDHCDNNAKVVQCEWGIPPLCERCAAGHEPPVSENPNTGVRRNRGLEVIYEFFMNYERNNPDFGEENIGIGQPDVFNDDGVIEIVISQKWLYIMGFVAALLLIGNICLIWKRCNAQKNMYIKF